MEVGELGIYYIGSGKAYRVRIMRKYVRFYDLEFVDAPKTNWSVTAYKDLVIPYPPELSEDDLTAYAKVMRKLR